MPTIPDNLKKLTPPALAKLWGCKPETIIGFIRRGELQAENFAANPGGRPRYKIGLQAIAEFEQRRAVTQPKRRKNKRANNDHFTKYY